MLIPNQLIEVKMGGRNIKHYRNLGYDVRFGDIIKVPVEHLTPGSHVLIEVFCDVCGKKMNKSYQDYLEHHTYEMDCCTDCFQTKARKTCKEKYGVEYASQAEWFQEKVKDTSLKKYGTDAILKADIVRQKINQTVREKYDVDYVSQSESVKEQIKQTNIQKYGVSCVMQNPKIKQKALDTMEKKYGHQIPMQVPEIKAKAQETLSKNGTTRTSKQQLQLYEIVKLKYPDAELNFPYEHCSLDVFICVNNIKIDIEYDCWYWHRDKHKDVRRGKFLQTQGFKVLRVKSAYQLPTEQELFDAIDYLVNTEHYFKEIILSDWKECDGLCQQLQVEI